MTPHPSLGLKSVDAVITLEIALIYIVYVSVSDPGSQGHLGTATIAYNFVILI